VPFSKSLEWVVTSVTASQITDAIVAALEGGPPVVVATVVAAPEGARDLIGAKMLVRADGSVVGSIDAGAIDKAVRREAPEALLRHGVHSVYVDAQGRRLSRPEAREKAAFQLMLEVHERPAELLIVGGGHVGKALAVIGEMCGFSVTVVDDRPEYANSERFPEADKVICGRFEEVLRDYPLDANSYVVCVTRGHKHDEVSLRQVVESPAAYVGMIGSRRRVGAVLQHLLEDGVDPAAVERVHTPIGLDIGAETPEEIAVSIMAEIIQVRRGGSGRPLRELKRLKRGVAPSERIESEE
jgi:xanthine dehydrogenase accessory factor